MSRIVLSLLLMLLFFGISSADMAEKDFFAAEKAKTDVAFKQLQSEYPRVKAYELNGLTTRLYGDAFSFGTSPEASAEQFRLSHAPALGVMAEELQPYKRVDKSRSSQQLMYNQSTGEYKFTLQYYTQERSGIPVYGSELRVLVRNEISYPAVLAVSSLRSLGDFQPIDYGTSKHQFARDMVLVDHSELTDFQDEELVIWAGINDQKVKPTMAVTVVATNDFPEEWRYVIDAESGEVLYKEDLIIFEDVVGNVQGNATEGIAADYCEEEIPFGLPYARVNIVGGSTSYTDSDGNFTIPNAGTADVTVESQLRGQWFRVYDEYVPEELLSQTVTPPGPANFMQNNANTSEHVRAQVNAYYYANEVRDMVLVQNPSYPDVSTHSEFPVYVNRNDGYCPGNAWYSPSEETINFCRSGGGYPNTAWQSVIMHEFGHHLVNVAGSGQDQYGEGMSDCVAMLYVDDPRLGLGFYGSDCITPLRSADNTMQYPCSGSGHTCGQLLSGCVWGVRNAMITTYPTSYMDTIAVLCINSILLHTGSLITPQITIDWLALDDDDFTLDNGTPHYGEICTGFNVHNMDCPELSLIWFDYPNGRPAIVGPGVSTVVDVVVNPQTVDPVPGSGVMYYSVDGAAFTPGTMNQITGNTYEAVLPPVDCGQTLRWYVGADALGYGMVYDPATAPGSYYQPVVATEYLVAFEDDFETDQGWTFSGGSWARGTPTGGGGQYGNPDPTSAYEGDNVLGYNLSGDYENSMPEYHATTPIIDCSGLAGVTLKFYRWLGVETDTYDHAYVRISNNGTSWTTIWENNGSVEDNSWLYQEFDVSAYADGQATVYIRFTMGTTDGSWQYCGWNVDNLEVSAYDCDANSPQISTVDLPDWTQNQGYTFQMEAIGGTGGYSWADKNNDLSGTGLTLTSGGLLSGTPTVTGPVTFIAQVTDEAPLTDEEQLSFYINAAVSIRTTVLPDWTQGILFTEQLESQGGTGPIAWSDKNGDLAGTGLSMTVGGLITGIPTLFGVINFTAEAGDSTGSVGEKALSININQAVAITTAAVPDADKDDPYSYQLESVGGTGSLLWADKNNDLSGSGMTLDSTGLLSGTPTTEGDLVFTSHLIDDLGSEDELVLTLTVLDELHIVSEGTLPPWTVSNAYSQQLAASGGIGVQTWTDKHGDLGSTGLTLSSAGSLTGVPSDTGLIAFWAVVEDEAAATDEKRFTMIVNPGITITTAALPDWTANVAYSQQLGSDGGTGAVTWVDKNGDLSGTGLTMGTSGLITGTPTVPGQITMTAQASDQGGDVEETPFTFDINPALLIGPMEMPEVTSGSPLSQQLSAIGGTGILTWSDMTNDLDGTGLTLSTSGLLSGTPTVAGQVDFTARVVDEVGGHDERNLTIMINEPISITTLALPDWTLNQPYSQQLESSGGTGDGSWVDLNDDLIGTGLTLGTDGLLSGTPVVEGTINFTAQVNDEGSGVAEQALSVEVNSAIIITTGTVDDGTVDEPLNLQLEATGGTGSLTWTDLADQLVGTGLSLTGGGLLNGTPTSVMTITFTAEAADMTGAVDTQEYIFDILPAFICGDANGDLEVNILDITFIIGYLYQDGLEPDPYESADVNADGTINILDITFLIAYLYDEGPAPSCL